MNDKITFRSCVSCLFAIAGSLSAIASLWHIWRLLSSIVILNEIGMYYGTRAGVFAVLAVLLYAMCPCLDKSKSKLTSKCAFLSLSLGLIVLLFRTDWLLALVSIAPLVFGFIAMAVMASRAVKGLILPMTVFAMAVNSSLIFLVISGIFRGLWYGIPRGFIMNFLLAVISAPLISLSLVRSGSVGRNVSSENSSQVFSEQALVKLYLSSLACAFQDFALMLQTGLAYSFAMFMLSASISGSRFPDNRALFYLGAVLVCAMLLLLSTWFKYTAFALYRDKDVDIALSRLIGSCIFLLFMSLPLLYIDWRMALAALWVLPVTFLISRFKALVSLRHLILRLALPSTALTGALLFSQGKLAANVFLLFIMTVSRLYDPLEIVLSSRTGD